MMAAILCAPTGWLRVGGRDSAWKQEKLKAKQGARFVVFFVT